ncbi:DNA-processing protein DprA [Thomasclavelia cocleata]|uniref:DNA-processing protein DprA n=5 Tax=Thomasclavelia cocleata TaxID=69824 RepID=UPI00255AC580|nr:DNA-processing protein DprA [Thomasclavelia cocleata]
MEEILLYFSLKYNGNFDEIYNAVKNKEQVNDELKKGLFKKLKSNYTTIISKDYPQTLKKIMCPPFVLFYYGNLDLVNSKCIAIAGSTNPSDYGKEVTGKIVEGLSKENFTTVAGLGIGIEKIVHKNSIYTKGNSIAVLGSGIDYCYPKQNINLYQEMKINHLILSEYPYNISQTKEKLIHRKRIITGLSEILLVTESKEKGNAIINAGFALEQGKEIFAIPSPINSVFQGTNDIIKNGGSLLNSIEDILNSRGI